jgi:cytolysin-activating lysine-acyltransferase
VADDANAGYRYVFLADLEWMVMPPILLKQYQLFNEGNKVVGFAAWAYASDVVEARLKEGNSRLAPGDWKSGDNIWLINLFAPFGHSEMVIKKLSEDALKEKAIKLHRRQPNGTVVVDRIVT